MPNKGEFKGRGRQLRFEDAVILEHFIVNALEAAVEAVLQCNVVDGGHGQHPRGARGLGHVAVGQRALGGVEHEPDVILVILVRLARPSCPPEYLPPQIIGAAKADISDFASKKKRSKRPLQ